MGITALVMAGGKGTRMQLAEEKPLIKVCGKPAIEYVITALNCAKKIMSRFPVKLVETPGRDYVSDMGYAAQNLKLGVFLAIAADLPLVTPQALDSIVEHYEQCGKPALTVAVPLETKTRFGMSADYKFKMDDRDVVPTGINVIDGSKRYGDEWLDQDIYLLDLPELAVNINTVQELKLAERLLKEKRH